MRISFFSSFVVCCLFSYSIAFVFFNSGTEDRHKKKYRPVLPFCPFRSTIKEDKCNRIRKQTTDNKRTEEGDRHLGNVLKYICNRILNYFSVKI